MKKINYSIGSIVAIPIDKELFAFAKIFADDTFGVYDLISKSIETIDEIRMHEFAFYQAATDIAVKNGSWPIVGVEEFYSKEKSYPPPFATCYIKEKNHWTMGGFPRIFHKGEIKKSSLEHVAGLWILSVCNSPEAFIRLIEDILINKNGNCYKVST